MAADRLVLRRFNGDEIYNIASAVMRIQTLGAQISVDFEVTTATPGIQINADTAEYPAAPTAEARIVLDHFDTDQLVGQQYAVPRGFDGDIADRVATFYYYDHQNMDGSHIQILAREGMIFQVRWTATTPDVNYYDGSKPDNQILIEAKFELHDLRQS